MTDLYDDDGNLISKTQRKKECDQTLELGEKIAALSKEELQHMDMDDELLHAFEECQKIKSNGALKRQKHYIAKLLRGRDIEPLASQLNHILHKHDVHSAEFKRMEKWRDTIIDDGDNGINAFLEQYPHADRHHLRQLVRNTAKEKKNNKPPASYRVIFKYIREIVEQSNNLDENGLY